VRELRALSRRYGVRRVCFTDNSLDRRAFREFLPRLTKARLDLQFEYEMRASLTRRQVRQLANAGLVAAQLGVESLSSNVLRLLRKGVLAVQNLQAMKWLSEAGVEVKWNFLYGVPREEPSDYERLPELLRSISHLPPPQAAGPVRLDRFSSYFESPDPFALTGLSPALAYRYVYPFSDDVLGRMAYYFRCDQMGSSQTPEYVQPVLAAIEDWRNGHDHARLWWISSSERSLTLRDTRSCASCFEHRLVGRECDLYLFCDAARSFRSIERFVASWEGMDRLNRVELRRVLDRWIQSRILVELDGRFLSLALEFPAE
jgi:ribosomal peptide maturation radical SAM protein 1